MDQAARSKRLNDMGRIVVPSPKTIQDMTCRDDLEAGLFYGLMAGWPLGGVLTLMLLGQRLGVRGWAWRLGAVLLIFAALCVVEGGGADRKVGLPALWEAARYPLVWVGSLAILQVLGLTYADRPFARSGFLLACGLLLFFLLFDPRAALPTLLLSLALPWAVAGAVGLVWRRGKAA